MMIGVGVEKGVEYEEVWLGAEGGGGEVEGRSIRVTGMEGAGRPRVVSRTWQVMGGRGSDMVLVVGWWGWLEVAVGWLLGL